MPSTRIYLTGFMGSGKSSAGPHVARALGYRYHDVDRRIEDATGLRVAQYFERHGEDEFRRIERETVTALVGEERVVISLGGGVVADPATRRLLLDTGTLVWLKASPGVLCLRLAHSAFRRPLLWGDGGVPLEGAALRDRIESLLAAREAAYASAHVTVDANSVSSRDTAERIVRALTGLDT